MSFRQPFRAVPIKEGERYRRERLVKERKTALTYLGIAAFAGATVGIGSGLIGSQNDPAFMSTLKKAAVGAGVMRERAPSEGDYWHGCDEARLAGSAPIYRSEPGYREELDGDADGIACEPYRGV